VGELRYWRHERVAERASQWIALGQLLGGLVHGRRILHENEAYLRMRIVKWKKCLKCVVEARKSLDVER